MTAMAFLATIHYIFKTPLLKMFLYVRSIAIKGVANEKINVIYIDRAVDCMRHISCRVR